MTGCDQQPGPRPGSTDHTVALVSREQGLGPGRIGLPHTTVRPPLPLAYQRCRWTPSGLSRSACVSCDRGGCRLYSGAEVSLSHTVWLCDLLCPLPPYQPSFGGQQLTEPQRRFTRVHPSGLSLARLATMVRPPLGLDHSHFIQSGGNRPWTLAWGPFRAPLTSSDLVSHHTICFITRIWRKYPERHTLTEVGLTKVGNDLMAG